MWPVTAAGWLALVLSILTFAGILIGWGKSVQQFNDLRKKQQEMARQIGRFDPDLSQTVGAHQLHLDRMDQDLERMGFTLWGPQKNNGMYFKVNDIEKRVTAIEARNKIIDAIAAERERGAFEAGHEGREQRRRREDKLLGGE